MIIKNTASQGVYLYAWDGVNNVPKTGDSANITGTYSLDGATPATAFATANPTEISGQSGWYWQPLAQAETNGLAFSYSWTSTTTGVTIRGGSGFTGQVSPTSNVKKNQALAAFPFAMTDSTNHAPAPALTVTATRSLDGGAFGACANAVAEVASGGYKIDLAAADVNANTVMLKFAATGADTLLVAIITQP